MPSAVYPTCAQVLERAFSRRHSSGQGEQSMSESEPTDAPFVQETSPLTQVQTDGWVLPGGEADAVEGRGAAQPQAPIIQAGATPVVPQPIAAAATSHVAPALPGQGHLGHLLPTAPAPGADPAARKHKRKRVLWTLTAVVAVLALAGVGVVSLLPGRTGNSVVSA